MSIDLDQFRGKRALVCGANPDRHEYRKVKPGGGFTSELDALYAAGWVFHVASNSGVTVKRERPDR